MEPSVSLPKEKAFSIAAALPVPSYSALMDGLSTNEEQLPFSQNEHSAQHIAQQLTLLQQVAHPHPLPHTHTVPTWLLFCCYSFFTSRGRHVFMNVCAWWPQKSPRSDFKVASFVTGNVPGMPSSTFPEHQNTRSQGQSFNTKQVSIMVSYKLLLFIQMSFH